MYAYNVVHLITPKSPWRNKRATGRMTDMQYIAITRRYTIHTL